MPKLRKPPEEVMDRAVTAAIVRWQELTGSDYKTFCTALGIGKTTFFSRMKHPKDFDIGDLRVMARRGILSLDDVAAALGYRQEVDQ